MINDAGKRTIKNINNYVCSCQAKVNTIAHLKYNGY